MGWRWLARLGYGSIGHGREIHGAPKPDSLGIATILAEVSFNRDRVAVLTVNFSLTIAPSQQNFLPLKEKSPFHY